MQKILLSLCLSLCVIDIAQAQLANWTGFNPSKFPTNRSGQIHGQARVVQMKFHPTNPNKYYALTAQGGLFTSNDGGDNWTVSAGTDALTAKVASICIDHSNDQVLYLGGGDPNYYGSGSGIYKSTNGGASFTQMTGGLPTSRIVVEILMHPTNANTIVAATNGGIYKTTNGGTTWTAKTSTALRFCDMQKISHADSRTLLACTNTTTPELYRSYDFGDTWTLVTSGLSAPAISPIQSGSRIAVTPADSNIVYFGLVSSGGMLYKSINGSADFTLIKDGGSPYLTFYNDDIKESGQGNYNFAIGVDRLDANKIWLHSHNNWHSSNGGMTWTMLTFWSQKLHTDMHQVVQSPYDPTKLYSCNDGGVWVSTDGGNNWTPKSDGIFAYEIGNYAGKGSPTNRDFINIGTQDNGELYGDATGWYTIRGGDWYAYNEIDYRPNSTMMYYGENAKRRSLSNLSQTGLNLPVNTIKWSAITFNRTNSNLAFTGLTDTILRSTDILATTPTWTQLARINSPIRAIHSCTADANRLYILTSDQKIHVSSNALAPTPTFVNYALPTPLNSTATLTAMCNNADIVYIAINNKVYRSSNAGANWTDITYNLPSVNHRRILSESYGGTEELVFIATNNAVYYKKAGQTTWTNYSTNLPNRQSPTELSLYDDGTNNALLRYMSYGRGVFQTPFGNLRPFAALAAATKSANPCVGNVFTMNNVSTGAYTSLSWSFPGGSPATSTDENPVVSYPSVGNYTATLTITNAASESSMVAIPISVTRTDNCSVDPIADKALQNTSDADYFVKTGANLTNLTHFTTSAWIKPNGAQYGFAGIVSNGQWCAHCADNTNGLIFDYNGTKLWYRWAGVSDTWASNSGMTVPLNQWSYVAMVVTPDSIALYLNDQKYVRVFAGTEHRPTAATIADLYVGYGHYVGNAGLGYYKGQIDEVAVWNRALTQNEIRDLRHLTKENLASTDPNFKAYFQFNEQVEGKILDKKRTYHGTLRGNAALSTSAAPIGSGVSERQYVASGGVKNFSTPQVDLEFPPTGTFPNGEVVVTRLNVVPDQNPTTGTPLSNKHWIVNNYGANQAFSPLASIKFNNLGSLASPASNFKLYKRTANAEGATWGTNIDGADNLASNALTFTPAAPCMGILNFGQFTITDDAATPPPSLATAECAPSTLIGRAMSLSANGQYMLTPPIDLGSSTDQITIMAWIRPNTGTQSSYTGILSCSAVNVALNYRDNNELGLHWNNSEWSWSSGAIVPQNEWSHVALVAAGTTLKLYLNGKEYLRTANPTPLNFTNRQWYIGNDRGTTGRTFKGSIDEVCFYNRTLTQAEIQEQMHLVKNPATDATLKGYFQFNETSGIIWNKSDAGFTSFSGGATNATSTAPVATGTSQRMNITTSGVKDFPNQHLSLDFASGSTLPNGDIVVSELNAAPDQNPTGGTPLSTKYWVINNYGVNAGLTLNSLSFNNLLGFAAGSPANYNLFKRNSGYDAASTSPSWGNALDVADALTNANNQTLTFSTGNNVTSFSQFTISSISVLTVELLSFNALLKDKKGVITWQVADEKDVNYYIIERSFDGKSFEILTKQEKSSANGHQSAYNVQDAPPQYGVNYYRLKIVERDGKITYSPIKSIIFNGKQKTDFTIYPNPTTGVLNIQFNTEQSQFIDFELINAIGQVVYQYKLESREGNNHLFFNTHLFSTGLYSLKIRQGNVITTQKVVIGD